MKLFISRTSDVLVFSDEMIESDLQDLTGETIYQDEEGETYYEVDAQDQSVYVAYCVQEKWISNKVDTLRDFMEKVNE
jgi:hypothetical protein